MPVCYLQHCCLLWYLPGSVVFPWCKSYKTGVGRREGQEKMTLASVFITFRGKPGVAGWRFAGAEVEEQDKDRRTRMKTLAQCSPSA